MAASPRPLAPMRSKLFVPGSRPEFFAKAVAGAADALSFDLEDAVVPARKAEARAAVAAFLRGRAVARARKIAIVRVNGLRSGLFEADVAALVGPGLDAINLPMVERAEDIHAACAVIARAEEAAGPLARPIGLLANIETPRGLRLAAEIAAADPRVVGLQIGYGDLFAPFGIAREEEHALQSVRLAVRLAAAEAGIPAFDGSLAAVAQPERCRAEAEAARRLGFAGKSCIHPSQVPIVNAVFVPRPEEVARARRILDAARQAEARGVGAVLVDGQMVDGPYVESAQAVLDLAASFGLGEEGAT